MKSVLIANRGEVVVRVARTLRAMGIRSVGIFAPAERGAPHTEAVDEAREVASYLDIPSILAAAKGVDALHPGWGFLSQNPAFAEAVEAAGIIFIGPSGAAMRLMGDKAAARAAAIRAGVPVAPGGDDLSPGALAKLGLPVMLKAVAGGGGKGLRRLDDLGRAAEEVESARREARAAFGDDRMFVEKLIAPARHVEVQVFGDGRGGAIALGERDCTLQRRFQKIIEEAPGVEASLRAKMEDCAVKLAVAAGYANAGTVEFLLQPDGRFYFMEMNTRLQVEHPVTEEVRGLDLVRLQVELAGGGALPATLPPIRGHAIEARLYAEDPEAGFLPMSGRILKLVWPAGLRVEHALREGLAVTPDYDPMLAKLIAHGADREEARRKLLKGLRETVLLGVQTNQAYLIRLLESKAFIDKDLALGRLPAIPPEQPSLAAWSAAAGAKQPGRNAPERNSPAETLPGPWEVLGGWRLGAAMHQTVQFTAPRGGHQWDRLMYGGVRHRVRVEGSRVTLSPENGPSRSGEADPSTATVARDRHLIWVSVDGLPSRFEIPTGGGARASADELRSPMTGKLVALNVKAGDAVLPGQVLAVVGAMKMEFRIEAPQAAKVLEVRGAAGEQVELGAVLFKLGAP